MDPSLDAIEPILNCLKRPAILLSKDYQVLAANRAYREVYAFDGGPIRKHCYQVSHGYSVPCDMAGESCPLKDSLRSGENSRVLHIHHTPRGKEYVNVEMWPVKDIDTDEVLYFIEQMHPSDAASTQSAPDRLIGQSRPFQTMLGFIERVAPSNVSVMLLGESGTGKELVAQTIHRLSNRDNKPFVPVECTGLPESLFESELFGYVKGAFTGANTNKTGLVAAADGGTLFLDEVGDIPPGEQVKLLRLLETRRYRPVGSSEWREADFRLICATNKDLTAMVQSGSFREDLFYRLNVFEIELPALRARPDDIELLIQTLLERLGAPEVTFDNDAIACLKQYDFPGNIRELRNITERAVLLANDGIVHPEHLPRQCLATSDVDERSIDIVSLAEAERRYLHRVLALHQGDRKQLAVHLGISERALYRKLADLKT